MSETVVDTLACQLRQDEQAARLFAKHLANVDAHLRRLSQHLHASVPDNDEPSLALTAVEGYADAVLQLEAGLQSVFTQLQRMQASQAAPGLSAALAEHSATLRGLQGALTAALAAVDEIATACTAAQPH
jgi:hypothetical protein